jgi:hypothetical protein
VRKVTERKMGSKHLLEACKDKHVNAGRARKVTERKMCNKHLLEVWEAIFKYDEKGRKKGEKARKVTERKKVNMHLLETAQGYICKGGKGEGSDGKKDMQLRIY